MLIWLDQQISPKKYINRNCLKSDTFYYFLFELWESNNKCKYT